MQLVRLHSIDALVSAAADYNDLWRRSEVALPAARAESLAAWLERFAPRACFELLVVADAGRFVAALPLVERRIKGLVPAACLPVSPWWTSGELLVDDAADRAAALDCLVAGFGRLPQPLVWLDAVRFAAPRWQALLAAIDRAGLPASIEPQAFVGQVEIEHDWDDYQARWSRGHRRKLRGARRQVEAAGGVELRVERPSQPRDIEALVRTGFEIEDRNWKGAAGSSVLSQPGMLEFYVEQARRLAAAGCLELAFLEHRGQAIAFEYGLAAKGTYFSYKIGYDERFAELTPGLLLRTMLVERFHAEPERKLVDFAGPLSRATASFSTRVEPVGRIVVGAPSLAGRWASAIYRGWRRAMRSGPAATGLVAPGVRPRSTSFSVHSIESPV